MDDELEEVINTQIDDFELRIKDVIAQAKHVAATANLLRSIPGIGPDDVR